MNVNEMLEELQQWKRLDYGDAEVKLLCLETGKHYDAEEINPLTLDSRKNALEIV